MYYTLANTNGVKLSGDPIGVRWSINCPPLTTNGGSKYIVQTVSG